MTEIEEILDVIQECEAGIARCDAKRKTLETHLERAKGHLASRLRKEPTMKKFTFLTIPELQKQVADNKKPCQQKEKSEGKDSE